MKRTYAGFTLIELMIVVAIIGILAAIAVPKMTNLMQSVQEGATKGNLGTLRSALRIYAADHDGTYPIGGAAYQTNSPLVENSLVPLYIAQMPYCNIPLHHVRAKTVDNFSKFDLLSPDDATCDGEWGYVANQADSSWGTIFAECWDNDTKGKVIANW